MTLTIFAEVTVSFEIESFNHYGNGFYCIESKAVTEELLNFLGHNTLYAQHTGTYTIGRAVQFKLS